MRLSQLPDNDFARTLKYVCNLCGFPEPNHEKQQVIISFLKANHGNNTDEDLIQAFTALASGRLDEKAESFKTLTGLSASRVLQSYARQRRVEAFNELPPGKTVANDETIKLIQQFSGRMIRFDQEITRDEHRMLMDHWISQQRENYRIHKRVDLLTSTSFDYLEKNGTLRVKGDYLQMFDGKTYINIVPWMNCQNQGNRLKAQEQLQLNTPTEFRTMTSPSAGGSLSDAVKRVAMGYYFDYLNKIS